MDFVKFIFADLIFSLFNKTLSFFEVLRNSKINIVGRVSIDLFLVNLISYFFYAWFEIIVWNFDLFVTTNTMKMFWFWHLSPEF